MNYLLHLKNNQVNSKKISNYLFITKVSNYLLQTKHIKLVLNYYNFYQIIYYKQKKLNYLIIIYFKKK